MAVIETPSKHNVAAIERSQTKTSPRWQIRYSWSLAMESVQNTKSSSDLVPWDENLVNTDLRVSRSTSLISASQLKATIPMSMSSERTVLQARREAEDIIHHRDDRLLVIVGPCSIHDTSAALEYTQRLKIEIAKHSSELCIVMRGYFEKPRTTTGWKGLINDPDLNDTYKMNKGLHIARQLYSDITQIGVPVAGELLDLTTPPYLANFLSLGAIGARTTESQPHRELASSMPFPIGFKNATNGDIGVAINSMVSSSRGHIFASVSDDGTARVVNSTGNPDGFVVLRGGSSGPNYSSEHVTNTRKLLVKAQKSAGIMIDCSHGNSNKDFRNQSIVVGDISAQMRAGQRNIVGVMIESNLREGNQKLGKDGLQGLQKGVSITDECIGWDTTVELFEQLAEAVRARRKISC